MYTRSVILLSIIIGAGCFTERVHAKIFEYAYIQHDKSYNDDGIMLDSFKITNRYKLDVINDKEGRVKIQLLDVDMHVTNGTTFLKLGPSTMAAYKSASTRVAQTGLVIYLSEKNIRIVIEKENIDFKAQGWREVMSHPILGQKEYVFVRACGPALSSIAIASAPPSSARIGQPLKIAYRQKADKNELSSISQPFRMYRLPGDKLPGSYMFRSDQNISSRGLTVMWHMTASYSQGSRFPQTQDESRISIFPNPDLHRWETKTFHASIREKKNANHEHRNGEVRPETQTAPESGDEEEE